MWDGLKMRGETWRVISGSSVSGMGHVHEIEKSGTFLPAWVRVPRLVREGRPTYSAASLHLPALVAASFFLTFQGLQRPRVNRRQAHGQAALVRRLDVPRAFILSSAERQPD